MTFIYVILTFLGFSLWPMSKRCLAVLDTFSEMEEK